MNKVSKLLIILIFIILASGCGKAKSPTGGPEDRQALQIEYIFPDNYGSVSEGIIEMRFNKEVDKRSAQNAFRFYPPLENVRIKSDDNTITLIIEDELIADRNYYLTISRVLKDTRNNLLEDNVTYTYSNGKLHDSKIFGDIIYEREEDKVFDKKLILLDQDSIIVFVKKFSGDFYDIDGLEHIPYIIRSFIDKNNNDRYDIEKEPYFESFIDSLRTKKADINLAYVDTSKVVVKRVSVLNNKLVQVTFSEEVTKFDSLSIISLIDTTNFSIYNTVLDIDKLSIITALHDTIDYQLSLYNLVDLNNNLTPLSRIKFAGSTLQDTLNVIVTASQPKNGSTVKERIPEISVSFDKIVMQKDIVASLKENETNSFVDMQIILSNSYQAIFKPSKALKNFNSYTFTLSEETTDFNGNKMLEDLVINFMVTGD